MKKHQGKELVREAFARRYRVTRRSRVKRKEKIRGKSSRKRIPNKKYTDPEWTYLVDLSTEDGGQSDKEVGKNETDQDKKRTEREDDKPP